MYSCVAMIYINPTRQNARIVTSNYIQTNPKNIEQPWKLWKHQNKIGWHASSRPAWHELLADVPSIVSQNKRGCFFVWPATEETLVDPWSCISAQVGYWFSPSTTAGKCRFLSRFLSPVSVLSPEVSKQLRFTSEVFKQLRITSEVFKQLDSPQIFSNQLHVKHHRVSGECKNKESLK